LAIVNIYLFVINENIISYVTYKKIAKKKNRDKNQFQVHKKTRARLKIYKILMPSTQINQSYNSNYE